MKMIRSITLSILTVFLFCFAAQAFEVPGHSDEWLSRKQPTGAGLAVDPDPYYTAIGAYQNVPNFARWKNRFGFTDATQTISLNGQTIPIGLVNPYPVAAKYFNKLDLGIGRDMHCSLFSPSGLLPPVSSETKGVACFVTNYGELPLNGVVTDDLKRVTLAKMHDLRNRGDTVAMTYDPSIVDVTKRVKFYIYDTKDEKTDANAGILNKIKLDSEGLKTSPSLCLSCHGGTYDTTTNLVKGANFLPFDSSLFAYEKSEAIQPIQQGVQEANFKQINAYVLATNPTLVIENLIKGLYKGTNTDPNAGIYSQGTLSEANANYVPEGWNEIKYKVAQKHCLMCHMALPDNSSLNFSNHPQNFSGRLQEACDSKAMPHAEVPYSAFWRSGAGYANCPNESPQGIWTEWLNRDTPNATGDYETLKRFKLEGENICDAPTAVECRTRDTRLSPDETGEVYSCKPLTGGTCKNAAQPDGRCLDYEVRFRCFETRASTWTPWLNRDTPNATGDYETLRSFKDEGENICDTPTAIECRTRDKRRTPEETGEVYSCEPRTGGACKNAAQSDRQCLDYEVRFECPTN